MENENQPQKIDSNKDNNVIIESGKCDIKDQVDHIICSKKNSNDNNIPITVKQKIDEFFDDSKSIFSKHSGSKHDYRVEMDDDKVLMNNNNLKIQNQVNPINNNVLTEKRNNKFNEEFNLFPIDDQNKNYFTEIYKNEVKNEKKIIKPYVDNQNFDFFVFEENKKPQDNNINFDILDSVLNNLKDNPEIDEVNNEFNHHGNQDKRNKIVQENIAYTNINRINDIDFINKGSNRKKEISSEVGYGKMSIGKEKEEAVNTRRSSILKDNVFTNIKELSIDIEKNKKMTPYLIIDPEVLENEIDMVFNEILISILKVN